MTIGDIIKAYNSNLDHLDIEMILAHSLGKPREFVLTHPEYQTTSKQQAAIISFIKRRIMHEPIAYILGHKEFYGLDFIVDKNTLVPRPETELLVDLVIREQRLSNNKKFPIYTIDVGTGSGNIIISVASELKKYTRYYGIDISKNALKIARKNAKNHGVNKKIKFLHGNLLMPLIKKLKHSMLKTPCSMIIVANLPYLSKKIYTSAPADVKKYEPKIALYSLGQGLQHYHKLFKQIKEFLSLIHCSLFIVLEISPEQKQSITKIISNIFPKAKASFEKDLAGKWRVCKIVLK